MALGVFKVTLQLPDHSLSQVVVLAAPKEGKLGAQVAVAAALKRAGTGAALRDFEQVGLHDIDMATVASNPGPERAVYMIQFRPGGPVVQPVLVYANPEADVTAFDAAIVQAATTGSVPTAAILLATIDLDATT